MDLATIREKIDAIDAEIIALLAKRQALMPDVAAYKKAHNLPLYQPDREQAIILAKTNLGKTLGLDPLLIETIFLAIFENSRKIQSIDNKA